MHDIHNRRNERNLSEVDLNLVVAFDALARERNVTRAAQRLGLTQSAMSHALRRLRDVFGDPLLVRGRGEMTLTPRAEALVVPIRSGLVTLGRALAAPDAFEPRVARRTFTIASPDLFDVLAVPPLLERMRVEAPGIDVNILPIDARTLQSKLETGEVDVAIVPEIERRGTKRDPEPPSQGLVQQTLLRDRFLCFIREGHPALGSGGRRRARGEPRLSLASYAALSHVLISQTGEGRGFVDDMLSERGLRRRIALRLPHFYSALAIVAKSDLVVTAPTVLARLSSRDHRVLALSAPIALPEHSLRLVWHERFSRDAGHTWLRGLVGGITRTLA